MLNFSNRTNTGISILAGFRFQYQVRTILSFEFALKNGSTVALYQFIEIDNPEAWVGNWPSKSELILKRELYYYPLSVLWQAEHFPQIYVINAFALN